MLHSPCPKFLPCPVGHPTEAVQPNSSESREQPLNIQIKLKFPGEEQLVIPCFLYADRTLV